MFHKYKPVFSGFVKAIIPLAFGLLIFWMIFRKLNFREILSIIKQDVDFWVIALSLPFDIIANIARAFRWDLLIRPLGYHPKKSNLIYAVIGNYGVNLVFPRLGEVWRCTMITRYEKIPFTKLFGTLIIDRLSDTLAVALIVIAAFILNVPYFKFFFEQHPESFELFHRMATSIWTYAILLLIVLAVGACLIVFKHHFWLKKGKRLLANVWEGICSITRMEKKGLFVLYTLILWSGYFLYFYICFFAFDFTKNLGWNCGLIAFGMSSIAVAVPVQGSIGPWHAMVIAVLIGFGLSSIDAAAFAFCVHTIQLIFTAIVGLLAVWALPVANGLKHKNSKFIS
ncbi:MAG: flippase-like domain-containing protein [Candidatus Azobacteroides sp.]|nr:flippase-like domain-containing protein [Candidatus Azobacteroides sp.]